MNIVALGGRLVKNVELRTTTTGKSVVDASIACNRGEEVDYIDIRLWNKQAEVLAKYCGKGDYIVVNGEWRKESFTGKDGVKKYAQYCLVQRVEFTGKKNRSESYDSNTGYEQDNDFVADEFADVMQTDDDLPF